MKIYDLSPAQGVIMFVLMLSKGKSHIMNIPTSILIDDEMDFDILKEAIALEVERNDALRIRFIKEGKEAKQYFKEKEEDVQVGFLDFSGQTAEAQERALKELAGKGFKQFKEPLYRFYMIKGSDGTCGVFSNIHHLIMDSFAIMNMYKDIFEVYYALKNNTEMPKPLGSYEEILQKELEYPGSEREAQDEAFYREKFSGSEPIYTNIIGPERLDKFRKKHPGARHVLPSLAEYIFFTKAAHTVMEIGSEDEEKYFDFCREYNIPFQCLFTMGMRTYLSYKNRREKDISIIGTVARRATLKEKRSGGTRIHFYPGRTIMPEETTFMEGLEMIKENQNEYFRHIDYPSPKHLALIAEVNNLKSAEYHAAQITYQPVVMSVGDNLNIKTKWYSNGDCLHRLYVTIMHNMSKGGGMDVYYEHLIRYTKPEDIRRCHEGIVKIMNMGIANPDMTVGELLDRCEEEGIS